MTAIEIAEENMKIARIHAARELLDAAFRLFNDALVAGGKPPVEMSFNATEDPQSS